MEKIAIGATYRHFKGGKVKVLGLVRHSETLEEHVVYEHEDETVPAGAPEGSLPSKQWVRPASMWFDQIDRPEYKGPRFRIEI